MFNRSSAIILTRLKLSRPVSGLSYFYNVSGHVGWVPGNENNPDDEQLVQFLLREILMRGGGMAPGSWDFPDLSGKMDAVTGFWIFVQQRGERGRLTIDGVVSPARGGATYGTKEWTIVSLNSDYKTLYREDALAKIPSNPQLRISLRQALQKTLQT